MVTTQLLVGHTIHLAFVEEGEKDNYCGEKATRSPCCLMPFIKMLWLDETQQTLQNKCENHHPERTIHIMRLGEQSTCAVGALSSSWFCKGLSMWLNRYLCQTSSDISLQNIFGNHSSFSFTYELLRVDSSSKALRKYTKLCDCNTTKSES